MPVMILLRIGLTEINQFAHLVICRSQYWACRESGIRGPARKNLSRIICDPFALHPEVRTGQTVPVALTREDCSSSSDAAMEIL